MTVARGRATPPGTPQAHPQVGCQLIVFGQRAEEDLRGVLADVREAGFDGIEAHILQEGNAAAVRTALAKFGLVQWSLSLGYHQCVEGGDQMIDYAQGVGSKFIMVSGAGDHETEGLRAYEGVVDLFNRLGARCRAAGITFCYHNHSWEFQEYDGVTGLERLYALTDPDLVKACIDVFWIRHSGRDPVQFLRQYRDRIGYVHLKDLRYVGPEPRRPGILAGGLDLGPERYATLMTEAEFAELGAGEVDFPGIWEVLRPLNLPWIVYEQDRTTLPPAEAAAVSRRYLQDTLGF